MYRVDIAHLTPYACSLYDDYKLNGIDIDEFEPLSEEMHRKFFIDERPVKDGFFTDVEWSNGSLNFVFNPIQESENILIQQKERAVIFKLHKMIATDIQSDYSLDIGLVSDEDMALVKSYMQDISPSNSQPLSIPMPNIMRKYSTGKQYT